MKSFLNARPCDFSIFRLFYNLMKKLTGISAASGIAIGKAFLYLEDDFPEIPRYSIKKNQAESEWKRFLEAVGSAAAEIAALHERAEREMSKEQADIFAAHLMMLEDSEFQGEIKAQLEEELKNIEWVVWDIARKMGQKLIASQDAYLRERAADITDVSRRLIRQLLAIKKFSLSELAEDVILVAHDLLPSDVLTMNRERVKGIVMDMGGQTSHTAILARAFEIPAVLGLSNATKEINNGDELVVDGGLGQVAVNPRNRALSVSSGRRVSTVKWLTSSLKTGTFPRKPRTGAGWLLK
jgi:phosphotransferase system enzyme I (PtsI)